MGGTQNQGSAQARKSSGLREPLFILTDADYSPVGAIEHRNGRYLGVSTNGDVLFNRQNLAGAEQAAKKVGRMVSSAWYGIQS